jgi:multisubunit Na+/H+ antiporter MnhF subunit
LARDIFGVLFTLGAAVCSFWVLLAFGEGVLVAARGMSPHGNLENLANGLDELQDPLNILMFWMVVDLYLLFKTGRTIKDRVTRTRVVRLHTRNKPVLLVIAHIAIYWLKLLVIGIIGTGLSLGLIIGLYKLCLPQQHKRLRFGRTPRDYGGPSWQITMDY